MTLDKGSPLPGGLGLRWPSTPLPIIHEAITESPDPAEFMPIEVTSAFPKGAPSALSVEEQAAIDVLIEEVPDEDDTAAINYWRDLDDKKVYLEGWIDQCLASTGFPPMEGGEWDEKVQYMIRVGNRTLTEKQEEKNRPIGLYPPGHLNLIEGGFRQFEAGEKAWLYGVTWGIYGKEGTPRTPSVAKYLTRKGLSKEGGNPMTNEEIDLIANKVAAKVIKEVSPSVLDPTGRGMLLHFTEHAIEGAGLVVNEARAKASPCNCFTYNGREYCFSPGVIGMMSSAENPEQIAEYCKVGKTYEVKPGIKERFESFAEAAEEAHKKIEEIPKGERLAPWLSAMSEELEKRGIEV